MGNYREYYIGIDLGTTNIKSGVFDGDGNLLKILRDPTPITKDRYGQVYNHEQIFNIVKGQLLILFDEFENIQGISITGMAEAGLIINREKNCEESYIIPWFDPRTVDLANNEDKKNHKSIFKTTGLHNSYKYGIYKYLWLLNNTQAEESTTTWLSLPDYIVWKLTGVCATDPTLAARTYVFDIVNKSWDYERLDRYGLNEDNFPKILPSGSIVGIIEEKDLKSKIKGCPIPVSIAGHDHVCAAYGVLGNDKDRICNSIGTAETYIGLQESLDMNDELYESGMVYGPFIDGHSYFWMANISSSGQSVEWFRKVIRSGAMGYAHMDRVLNNMASGPTNILYYPYLSGIGTPAFNPDIGGALIGLREIHDNYTILKAVIEGINYQGKWVLSLVPKEIGSYRKGVVCVGGAAKSPPWMQLKANVLGMDVIVPDINEATLLGSVAIMMDKNYPSDNSMGPINNQDNKVFKVENEVNKQYGEVFNNRFIPLLDAILNQ